MAFANGSYAIISAVNDMNVGFNATVDPKAIPGGFPPIRAQAANTDPLTKWEILEFEEDTGMYTIASGGEFLGPDNTFHIGFNAQMSGTSNKSLWFISGPSGKFGVYQLLNNNDPNKALTLYDSPDIRPYENLIITANPTEAKDLNHQSWYLRRLNI